MGEKNRKIIFLYMCSFVLLLESTTKKIMAAKCVHKSQATSSSGMEVLAAEQLLDALDKQKKLMENVKVKLFLYFFYILHSH